MGRADKWRGAALTRSSLTNHICSMIYLAETGAKQAAPLHCPRGPWSLLAPIFTTAPGTPTLLLWG
jgi:hypothetical protein